MIGYTATMSTLASDTAQAAASLPSQTMSFDFGLRTALMRASSIITMARCGHSVAQMPQPLQVCRSKSNQAGRSTTHCTGQ